VLKFPFNPKKETIVGPLDMFIELYDIAVMARKKFGNGMNELNLIRAADQQDCG
tara:strand:+ start:489 stop:650 length:162 start_codon:yes stop_codon:yes gene_type:complete